MLTLRLPPALAKSLGRSARAAKQTKSAFVRDAVLERIAEAEDHRIAVKRLRALKAGKSRTYTAEEIKRDLGLAV
jgi:RHH-type rel operon transcriptional repressor/antitoxin RelB